MAKIIYTVKRNNTSTSKAFGKFFATAKSTETLNTRQLAEHIADHGSVYTQDVVFGVLEKFRTCLIEMLLDSKKVKIDGLGTFYCTLQNVKGGADKEEDFNTAEHIAALHIRFLPEQAVEMNISSREFIKRAHFVSLKALNGLKSESEGGSSTGGTDSGDERP